MARTSKPRLGRGLSSLMSEPVEVVVEQKPAADAPSPTPEPEQPQQPETSNNFRHLAITSIVPSRFQARQEFDEDALRRLAASIKTAGVMQPIAVRTISESAGAPAGAEWELVSGERRWRAAQLLNLATIPAVVVEANDRDAAEWGVIENIQREDLNPMEASRAFHRLRDEFGLTQFEIADQVGVDRSTVANILRLTELEPAIQALVESKELSLGHAKALLAHAPGKSRTSIAKRAVQQGWSVRTMEANVKRAAGGGTVSTTKPAAPAPDANVTDLEKRLGEYLGTRVRMRVGAAKTKGRIEIEFYDLDQFDGLLQKIGFRAKH